MLKGRVDANFDSIIPIELFTDDSFTSFEVTIDTGFNGDLVLPQSIVSKFGFTYLYSTKIDLVGNTTKEVDFFKGKIKWLNGDLVTIEIIADEAFLIGTNLLKHGKLWIDYQSNEVLIKE
jgi:clan AA aspartic protease